MLFEFSFPHQHHLKTQGLKSNRDIILVFILIARWNFPSALVKISTYFLPWTVRPLFFLRRYFLKYKPLLDRSTFINACLPALIILKAYKRGQAWHKIPHRALCSVKIIKCCTFLHPIDGDISPYIFWMLSSGRSIQMIFYSNIS